MPTPSSDYWAKVKPFTTNDIYGFFHKRKQMQEKAEREEKAAKRPATADPTSPKESLHLPSISNSRVLAARSAPPSKSQQLKDSCFMTSSTKTNRKLVPYIPPSHSRYFTDGNRKVSYFTAECLDNDTNVGTQKGKVLYLWHTLSGCLVHVRV